MVQTILGAGGAIGIELAKALKSYTDEIRIVARNPEKVNETDQIHKADLLVEEEVRQAIKGSSIVYVVIGFPYQLQVWKKSWPRFISFVLDACEEYNSKLVFFDNIYMYDKEFLNGMDENTPINPSSKKGNIRMIVANMIMEASEQGRVKALIARCADYYGPSIQRNSVLTETVFAPLSQGKTANWMASLNYKHSYTYVPDAGIATAILGNSEDAYNQVWHLPTASNPPTGKEWVESIANEMGMKPRVRVVPSFLLKIMGLFSPVMKELPEMMYQYDRDYVFDSSKFEQVFDFKPTSYEEGIREVIRKDYSPQSEN